MTDTSTATSLTRTVDGVELPEAGTYAIDAAHSHVGFTVRHLMVSKVRGSFGDFEGTITIAEEPAASHVEVVVRLASIDTRDAQRDAHLRSGDFFDIEAHPTMAFRSTGLRHLGGDGWVVDGELTIGGVTRPLQLTTTFEGSSKDPWGGTRIGFSARGEVDREEFGLTWNQALETGGVLVGKKAVIELEVEAART